MNSRGMRPLLLATALLVGLGLSMGGAFAAVMPEPPPTSPLEVQIDTSKTDALNALIDETVAELQADLLILADKNTLSPKDGCHNSKAVGYRHYHDDEWNALGTCGKEGDINYRVPDVEPVRTGPSELCQKWLSWLEGAAPADWQPIDKTTFGGHPIVHSDYVPRFVAACRE